MAQFVAQSMVDQIRDNLSHHGATGKMSLTDYKNLYDRSFAILTADDKAIIAYYSLMNYNYDFVRIIIGDDDEVFNLLVRKLINEFTLVGYLRLAQEPDNLRQVMPFVQNRYSKFLFFLTWLKNKFTVPDESNISIDHWNSQQIDQTIKNFDYLRSKLEN